MKPLVYLVAGVAPLLATGALAQAQPTISVDTLERESTHWKAVVRITNGTRQSFSLVGFRCTFMSQGRAVDNAGNVALNVAAGETVFEKIIGPYSSKAVDSASCRITYANR